MFDFYGIAITTAVIGFLRTWLHVPLPLVFAEHLPAERYGSALEYFLTGKFSEHEFLFFRFPSGYGLFMFINGNITLLVGPFTGWIRDVTQSYAICFHALTFVLSMCAIPWLLEIIYFRMKPKKATKEELIN